MNVAVRTRVALALMGRGTEWLRMRTRLGANTIDRLLSDVRREPSARTLERVAGVLGVSKEWLVADVEQRELSSVEEDELNRCVLGLRRLAEGVRVDARAEPNVWVEKGLRVPRLFGASGARHVYRVRGRSLIGFGLRDGDLVFVKPLSGAVGARGAVGSIVLVRLDGALYLKQLTIAPEGAIVLCSAHDGYDPLVLRADDSWELLGQVIASARMG